MTLLSDSLSAYLNPLLEKHAANKLIQHEDLEESWKRADHVLKQNDEKSSHDDLSAVVKHLSDLHQSQLKAYQEAAVDALHKWAQTDLKLPLVSEASSAGHYIDQCLELASNTLPNWYLSTELMEKHVTSVIKSRAAVAYQNKTEPPAAASQSTATIVEAQREEPSISKQITTKAPPTEPPKQVAEISVSVEEASKVTSKPGQHQPLPMDIPETTKNADADMNDSGKDVARSADDVEDDEDEEGEIDEHSEQRNTDDEPDDNDNDDDDDDDNHEAEFDDDDEGFEGEDPEADGDETVEIVTTGADQVAPKQVPPPSGKKNKGLLAKKRQKASGAKPPAHKKAAVIKAGGGGGGIANRGRRRARRGRASGGSAK